MTHGPENRLRPIAKLPNGVTIYVQYGGLTDTHRIYWTDSSDTGTLLWDTALISRHELLAALLAEAEAEYRDSIHSRVPSTRELT